MGRQVLVMQLKNEKHMTIMVSGASGIVGYGILRSLRELNCTLIGTTIYDESPANCFADIVLKAPMTSESNYLLWLKDTIRKYKIDMIIPAIEADMTLWNRHRTELENEGTIVLLNNSSLIELCLDKWQFYKKLELSGLPCCIKSSIIPNFSTFPIPFILKPRCGYGSRGIVKVHNYNEFEKYIDEIGKSLMMQEYVGTDDEEYTISAFFDNESILKAYIPLKRKLSTQGYTEKAEVIILEDIREILVQLAEIFKPIGPTNFQFRKSANNWKLLEINPRISSSTSIRKLFGYNESKMCIDYFLNDIEVLQPEIKRGKVIRYIEDYVFYDSNNI